MAGSKDFVGRSLLEERRRKQRVKNAISYVVLSIGGLIMIIPFLWTILTALREPGDVFNLDLLGEPARGEVKVVLSSAASSDVLIPAGTGFVATNLDKRESDKIDVQEAYPDLTDEELEEKCPIEDYVVYFYSTKDVKISAGQTESPPIELVADRNTAAGNIEKETPISLVDKIEGVDVKKVEVLKPFSSGDDPVWRKFVKPWYKNFVEAWNAVPFEKYYINSIIVSVVGTFGQLITCILAAYAFARLQWPGRNKVFILYLASMMIPGMVTMIPVFILMKNLGLIDTLWAIILPSLFSAYGTFMLRQYFLAIPRDLEEAAFIDGANRIQILFQIIVPLSKAAIATLATFTFLWLWNDFLWPLVVLNSDEVKTLPVGLQTFQGEYGSLWHLVMAASLIVLIPVLVVYILNQKFITEGIMLSGFGGR